ncbi:MAG TPA: DUF3631 domain-containing protein [Actinophytocola sp.]|nr:DUF3631 domain-containing protein [Actinophytocola sp.]HEV2780790.1 DUF3631 domain-containing protein [Actinophytocola sp.]
MDRRHRRSTWRGGAGHATRSGQPLPGDLGASAGHRRCRWWHWPNTARQACAHFVREADQQPVTTGVQLLADLRTIFADRETDRLATSTS